MLFSNLSVLTMIHGIVLGGGALMGLAAALFAMRAFGSADPSAGDRPGRAVSGLLVAVAVMLWIAVVTGTYVIFPPYRLAPAPGITDLAPYPRSLLLSKPDTAWLHAFAMETKEHMPWIASMLVTAVAFAGVRNRAALFRRGPVRDISAVLLVVAFALISFVALMGIFVNKVAPLQ
jgi:hypothetical protein